ncbi:uncharacterized protein [Dysidea avara]
MGITKTFLLIVLFQLITKEIVSSREITVTTSGNDNQDCLEGDYPCSSLDYVLNHLQSNDCVNITSNSVPLTTIVELHNLNAITIRGQGNTIVMCNNTGGVSCNNCSNVVIEGITWDGCGDPTTQNSTGGLTFTTITNLSIANCVLKNSKLRALHLHMVAGIINITGTQVINNANYDTVFCTDDANELHCFTSNHGAAGGLYVREAFEATSVYISNCNFEYNGQFGKVDLRYVNDGMSEITDGAAMKVVHSNISVSMKIIIHHTTFLSNRGYNGGAMNIKSLNSPTVTLNSINFVNNSVIQHSLNSSALMIHLNSLSPTTIMPILQISFCNFINNSDGRNVIDFIIAGQPSYLTVTHCNFVDNKRYEVGLVEMNLQSRSTVDLLSSDFLNNTGGALVYLRLLHADINISLHKIQADSNYGTSPLRRGGLISVRVFENHCIVNITKLQFIENNFDRDGGGLDVNGVYHGSFKFYVEDSQFRNNTGGSTGTVIYTLLTSDRAFLFTIYNSSFVGNSGGSSIVRIIKRSLGDDDRLGLLLVGQSTNFLNNSGGALTVTRVLVVGDGNTTFDSNTDNNGAALYLGDAFILPNFVPFQFYFIHNFAFRRGGAIYIDFPTSLNVKCNWLMYLDRNEVCNADVQTAVDCPKIDGNLLCDEIIPEVVEGQQSCSFIFNLNSAAASGNVIFYDVPTLPAIQNSSDPNSIFYIPESTFCILSNQTTDLSTQPFKIRLKEPAKCVDMDCVNYYITDIMLGEEIEIPAQVVGYNNKSAESTLFFVTCEENCTTSNGSTNYMITGTNPVLISDKFGGLKITGIQNGPPLKLHLFSISLQFDLVVELIPCRSGYTYNKVTMQCECFTTDGIVSCTPEPNIKRDYWFGIVDNTTTVSRCPYTYCNFRRREVSPGRFMLQSVQDDQCDSHRTGPACGSCEDGYTLPFDSVECINVDDCHPGYTVFVIIGVMAYWVIVIVTTFFLMLWLHRIRCNIGYLYGIVYYYSVVDILLGQIVSRSSGLSLLVPTFGGTIFKLYPGFLFKVCFVQGMDAIDQYVIHYTHPTAVLLLVWLLSKIAVRSQKFASIIGKAAIPTICLIVTLAYVSIADASLRLAQSLRFTDVDEIFTYLSPAIEYFTGRHIAYFIIAASFELIVGFGLPLVLLVEPFINHKIDFTKVKPLLDQFQGCYKDRFRWLASVYLIGRQMILIITGIDFSNPYTEQYLLMIVCVIIVLLHYLFQPYNVDTLNKYDGILLHILLLIASLKIVAFSDGFTTDTIVRLTYVLYFIPFAVSLIFLLHYIHAIAFKNKQTTTERSESIDMESARKISQSTVITYNEAYENEDNDGDNISRRSSLCIHYRDSFIESLDSLDNVMK